MSASSPTPYLAWEGGDGQQRGLALRGAGKAPGAATGAAGRWEEGTSSQGLLG